ncbi:MAG: cadherin domain-containing protein [Methylococcaceae bacterium]
MATSSQYATSVIAYSSQYGSGTGDWSAAQALGASNTNTYGDFSTAWAAAQANGSTPQTLTVGFATPVYATGVIIRENNGNGFVTKIEALANDGTYSTVWSGTDSAPANTVADVTFNFAQATSYLVKGVRITVDTNHSTTAFEEIDSVQLLSNGSSVSNHAPTNLSLSNSSVNENVVAGTVIGTLSSTDPDAGNTFTYSLVSGTGSTDNSAFTISNNQLKINASPDYETKSSYHVLVRTTDQDGAHFDKAVTVSINNIVNEGPSSQYASSVIAYSSQYSSSANSAAQALGTSNTTAYGDFSSAWAAAQANSSTPQTLTVGFATPVFATGVIIRENNGNGFVTKIEALANDGTYNTVWSGTDTAAANTVADVTFNFTQATSYLTKGVRITVDTNHSMTAFEEIDSVQLLSNSSSTMNHAPTNLSLSSSSVNENVVAGTVIGTLSSTDADAGNTFTYSLVSGTGSTDNSAFTISNNQLKINASPDYETKSSYHVLVRTTDQDGAHFDKALTVSINNLSEPNIVRIIGDINNSPSNDLIRGGDAADRLYGGDLNDSLYGGNGDDRLYGEDNNDQLYGQNGNDRLYGGDGNDTLWGGTGIDTLSGGAGSDVFVLNSTASSSNIDKISDFSVVDDTIYLENALFTSLTTTGTLAASAFNIGASAADSSDRIFYNNNTGALYYDDDGSGAHAAVKIATLGVALSLSNADFVVI